MKLSNNVYRKCEDFISDCKQFFNSYFILNRIFSNCILYNGSLSEVGKIGLNFEKTFE